MREEGNFSRSQFCLHRFDNNWKEILVDSALAN